MTQTNTANGEQKKFTMPTGDEIYDGLMCDIEMDLISVNLPKLDAKYANETPEDREARLERYQKAYAKYDEAYAIWMGEMNALVEKNRRNALRSAEAKEREQEAVALSALDAAMAV